MPTYAAKSAPASFTGPATSASRARKRLRKRRALIHAALTEAARMKRSRKKGTANLLGNLYALGFERVDLMNDSPSPFGGGGDVLDKFRPVP